MMEDQEHPRCPECGLILYKKVSQCPRCFAVLKEGPREIPEEAMVEEVTEDEIAGKRPKERQDIRRTAALIAIIAVASLLILSLSYLYIIPRVDIKIITVYRESSGLVINLDSKVKNEGTLTVQHFNMSVTVYNESSGMVAQGVRYISDLEAHSTEKFDNIYFYGDQYENYKISIIVSFETEGKDYSETFDHHSHEYMFQRWEDSFFQFGG